MDPGQSDILMTILLAIGGMLSIGGLVTLIADAGMEGTRAWSVLGQQVHTTALGIGAFVCGAVMMAASMLVTAGSSGMLSGSSAIAASGDYWPETEPNDEWRMPQPLPDGETLIGTAEPGDRDRFVVLADAAGPDLDWEFLVLPESGTCRLELRRPGSPLSGLAEEEHSGTPRRGTLSPGPGRELFFSVRSTGGAICRYLLTVTREA